MVEDEVRNGKESRVKEVLCWLSGDMLKFLPPEGSLIATETGFGRGLLGDSVSALITADLDSCTISVESVRLEEVGSLPTSLELLPRWRSDEVDAGLLGRYGDCEVTDEETTVLVSLLFASTLSEKNK